MLPQVIFFDLDDTIISFDGAAEAAWQEVCRDFAQNTGFCSPEDLLCSINSVRKWYWGDPERHKTGRMNMINARREIVSIALEKLKFHDQSQAFDTADKYSKLQHELICLFPASLVTLKELKVLGVRMALITNGSAETQRGKIGRFGLEGYFDAFFIEGELGCGKPDIRVYQKALDTFGIDASHAWMVGDNLVWDIEAPQKLGIHSIWNDFRGMGLPEDSRIKPDRIIRDISELLLPCTKEAI